VQLALCTAPLRARQTRTVAWDRENLARQFSAKAEEALIGAFRKHTLLPLDDCVYALQSTVRRLTRSSLHRCFRPHGISRPPETQGYKPAKKKFKSYPIGYFQRVAGPFGRTSQCSPPAVLKRSRRRPHLSITVIGKGQGRQRMNTFRKMTYQSRLIELIILVEYFLRFSLLPRHIG
jgi:hypothetical protein